MPQIDWDGFGRRLRRYRMEIGLTQEELAEKSGLSVRAISDIESGRTTRPRRSSLDRIADALEIPAAERRELMSALQQIPLPERPTPPGHVPGKSPLVTGPRHVVPRQLPALSTHFTGRAAELKKLNELLNRADAQLAGTVVSAAIVGPPGVGKSTLAVRWAYQVADRFPDGQLYVNLRGYDPAQPMTASDALAGFLRGLGLPGQEIPVEADERAALYRSLMSTRRILVVADNARSVEQVRPLMPAGPLCATVVTSRDALVGLVAREGARRLVLDQLPLAEAIDLLAALIGERVAADPSAAAALAAQCGRLPLSLRVAAELVISRPATPLADVVGELADQQRRLDLLGADGDPRTAMRAVFSWSYRVLDADARRAFRLLGLNPGPDIDRYATAALTDTSIEDANRVLDVLARAHLIQIAGPDRFGLHDLLRAFAGDLAASQDTVEERRAALTRLFDHYLQISAGAVHTLFPTEHRDLLSSLPSSAPSQLLGDSSAARAWLEAQQATLVAAVRYMTDSGWPGDAAWLATILYRYLESGDHYPEATAIHACARDAARHTGDRSAEATALTNLGLIDLRQGRYHKATEHHLLALVLFQETCDRIGEARVLGNLGLIEFQEGRYEEAARNHRSSLALYREMGDRNGQGRALTNLGLVEERQGRCQEAAECHQQALNLFRELGNRAAQPYPLANLGDVYLRQRLHQQAIDHYREALTFFRESHNRTGEAYALTRLGEVDLLLGRHQQASAQHGQALAVYHKTGDQSGQAQALNGLGESSLAAGRPGQARTQHTIALRLASQIGDKYQEARAHHGLARVQHAAGDADRSRRYWRQAHALYTGLGAPEAAQVRAELMAAGHGETAGQATLRQARGPGRPADAMRS
jgi:tetratricopeptide (TPR) repeat protein